MPGVGYGSRLGSTGDRLLTATDAIFIAGVAALGPLSFAEVEW